MEQSTEQPMAGELVKLALRDLADGNTEQLWFWFGSLGIAVIIAVAMVLNLLAAALSGVAIPLVLKRIGIDPALSGAVILTTVTDVVGFLSFLGLASLFLF